jgi:hypothetical protein
MAQGDYLIQNQSFPSFRSDLNSTLEAINTSNSGTSRPTSAVAGTIWLDTTNATTPTLKLFDGTDDISLATFDYSANTVNWLDSTVSADLVNDLSPQLGGMLDVNGNAIGNGTEELIKFSETASAVNEVTVTNSATGNAPEISATGDDTNIDFKLTPKGTGKLVLDGLNFPTSDGTTGQFLKTDGSGNLSFDDAGGGGKVLQVQNMTSTAETGTTGSTFVSTVLTDTITPSSTSSKILIIATGNLNNQGTAEWTYATIARDGTNLGSSFGMTGVYSNGGDNHSACTMTYLDSPSSTSSLTYDVRIKVTGSTGKWNEQNGVSSLTLIEIGA